MTSRCALWRDGPASPRPRRTIISPTRTPFWQPWPGRLRHPDAGAAGGSWPTESARRQLEEMVEQYVRFAAGHQTQYHLMFRTLPSEVGGPEGDALRGAALALFGRFVQAIHKANPALSIDDAADKALVCLGSGARRRGCRTLGAGLCGRNSTPRPLFRSRPCCRAIGARIGNPGAGCSPRRLGHGGSRGQRLQPTVRLRCLWRSGERCC